MHCHRQRLRHREPSRSQAAKRGPPSPHGAAPRKPRRKPHENLPNTTAGAAPKTTPKSHVKTTPKTSRKPTRIPLEYLVTVCFAQWRRAMGVGGQTGFREVFGWFSRWFSVGFSRALGAAPPEAVRRGPRLRCGGGGWPRQQLSAARRPQHPQASAQPARVNDLPRFSLCRLFLHGVIQALIMDPR